MQNARKAWACDVYGDTHPVCAEVNNLGLGVMSSTVEETRWRKGRQAS